MRDRDLFRERGLRSSWLATATIVAVAFGLTVWVLSLALGG